jgi:myo-inositol-1(or 4)-monophosphatase
MRSAHPTLDLDLQMALAAAKSAARLGSQTLLSYFGRLEHVSEKHEAGLVSEADIEAERVIKAELLKAVPAQFLGEESSHLKGKTWAEKGNWWIVDPLDGTTNYVHGFPVFCVSIGLMWEGELAVGLVEVPMLQATYWAVKGGGAFKNGKPIHVSGRSVIKDSLLATGFFRDQPEVLRQQLEIFAKLSYEARGIRRAGAAAYDLCCVAEGVFDAFWEKNLAPWDTAAGILLVREAGGKATDYGGKDFTFAADAVVASNGLLHSEILKATKEFS